MSTDTKLRTTTEYKINGHFVHKDVWDAVEGLRKQVKELKRGVMIERRDKDLYDSQLRNICGVD